MKLNHIYCGDALETLKTFSDESVDSIVTDPPAGISFMGKEWDTFDKSMFGKKGSEGENDLKVRKNFTCLPRYNNSDHQGFQDFICAVFSEAIRTLKPGAHALVWAIPQTAHHTAMGLERAGFEIRTGIFHTYGEGYPKSLNISKEIDRLKGAQRGKIRYPARPETSGTMWGSSDTRPWIEESREKGYHEVDDDNPITPEAQQWHGWGTGLKPAVEVWHLCRKPLSEKTIAENVLRWGTGALNIDACRIPGKDTRQRTGGARPGSGWGTKAGAIAGSELGRHPANLVHDGSEEVLECFPHNEAASFFYCAKPTKEEKGYFNDHPTVKPIALMQYLIKLITPPGGTVLDMFAGSGSTLIAAQVLGFSWIGVEKDPHNVGICWDRLERDFGLFIRRPA